MSKLEAEKRIEKIHVSLMRNSKFCLFSGLFMVGKVSISDTLPTANTNGIDVTYGRSFIDRLDDKQVGFLVLHEAMHKAYRHLTTWEKLWKKNATLANMACDYVINLQIKDYDPSEDFVRMPTDAEGNVMGCIDERFRGMDAGQVFAILEKEYKDRGGSGGSHKGDPTNKTAQGGNVPQGFDEHDWDGANEIDEKEAEEIAKEIDNALRQGALLAGKMNGSVSREIQDLLAPKIDWKEVMRDFIKQIARGRDDSSWKRFNRRLIGQDIYMPVSVSRRLDCVAIGTDTSGSIDGEILSQFLGEIKSICEEVTPRKVELMYWDTRVGKHETYEDGAVEHLTSSTKPWGGGGTDPSCVPKYMEDKQISPDCTVILTDGCFFGDEGNWSQINSPLLWVVKDNKDFKPKYGVAVHIN